MVTASEVRAGMAIRYEGQTYKVLAADYHPGQGKMGGVLHARLRNLGTGTTWEHSFRAELRLEEIPLDKRALDFLYLDGADCYFMDADTYEQFAVPAELIGEQARLLQADMRVSVEFLEERPISVQMPDVLEVRIADTAPAMHNQQDSTWKPARLESGIQIMVPQFIKTGDLVRLDTAQLKYMDRVKAAGK
ncbi:MAG TPA: elongation factor P [Bryobacteraceae bacterium]|nr:elongation factor P [Bryobacteraceae bacterium]